MASINTTNEDHEFLVRVAWYYYKAGMTQEEIANRFRINRVRVVKILEKARHEGIVSFHVNSSYANCLELEKDLIERWKLRDSFIIPEVDPLMVNRNLGVAAAQYVEMNLAKESTLIGFGWGNTVSFCLKYLSLKACQEVSLVTLSGGITAYFQNTHGENENPLSKFNNRFHIIPSPLLVTSVETCRFVLKEPEVAQTIRMAELANIAVVGIGAVSGDATFTRFGYISPQELEIIRKQGAVGDVLGQFYDKEGQRLDLEHHSRLIAVSLEKLKDMPHVIGIAGGDAKVSAIKAALQGGYIHSLITDERTALKLLEKEGYPGLPERLNS
jgi:DNA-binding transcriptional regulator LsrR (DeoR family)